MSETNLNQDDRFSWIEVYRKLFEVILSYENKQNDLVIILQKIAKLTKITKHAKRHFWLNDVCTCHGLLTSHSA